jgi:DNA-binding response OmpR family regulator
MTLDIDLTGSKILIVHGNEKNTFEDIRKPLKDHFANITGATKFEEIKSQAFDLIIVDYSFSDMNGILLYKKLSHSAMHCLIPAIFVADTKSYDHRLNAFEIGAADFISRPFDSKSLLKKCLLHIKNRRRVAENQSIHIGNLSLYPDSRSVMIDGDAVPLTHLEYKILYFLLNSPRQVVSRSEIYENIWGPNLSTSGRLDTQLYNLKKKLAKFNGKIKSVNKVGMRILLAESTFSQP